MFEPGGHVVVAVSGGADSVCMLHALWRLRRLFRVGLTCFHFDHRLRPESRRDATYVRAQADRLGLPFVLRHATSRPAKGDSVEAWARTVRYAALTEVAEAAGAAAAVGHTADDQAETVLLALVRGSGLDAVSGMRPVSRPVVRPLLEVTREETHAFCRALGLRPRHDPTNEDPAFLRVAIRTRVIPTLEAAIGRNVRGTLVRTAALLREDAELLERLGDAAASDALEEAGTGVALRAQALRGLERPLASRIVRRALLAAGVLPEAAHVDAVLALAAGRPGQRAELPAGLLARRDREYVRLVRPSPG